MKVLIIEPERSLLHSFERLFDSYKIAYESFFDPVVAINDCSSDFNLVLLDEVLPRISLDSTFDLIKGKNKGAKIVLIRNAFSLTSDELIKNQKYDDFIVQPFTVANILSIIEKFEVFNDKYDSMMTFKERCLISVIKNKGPITPQELKKNIGIEMWQIQEYITAVNQKIKGQKIEYKEKGFKLVSDND